ncbi:MAG TPA: hypothetical protein VGB73_16615 [Pyrinomonadaceae bacterium]
MNHLLASSSSFGMRRRLRTSLQASLALLALFTSLVFVSSEASAQKRITEKYPVRNNVRLHLNNRSGTITVEAWNRNEIKIVVEMESPNARFSPEVNAEGLFIDVVRDNRGRPDVGDVNFKINVPVNSMVDLETRRGNITVRGVEGAMMRAHVTSEGDIELTGIRSSTVMAGNTVGNIVFDAELMRGGIYELQSLQGDISIRITANSGFRLMGLGPNINLGVFGARGEFQFYGARRKVIGKVGEGGATLNVNNQFGTITFMPR